MTIRVVPINNHYELLGVARNATSENIKRAFRRLAFQYHPDHNREEGAGEIFKEKNEAHEVLIDPKKRAAYDKQLDSHIRVPHKPSRPTPPAAVQRDKYAEEFARIIMQKGTPGWAKVLAGVGLFLDIYLKANRALTRGFASLT